MKGNWQLDQSIQSKYDRVFNNSETQEDVFSFISPAINQFIKGFSCTIFAYGQTGSGKTYTMLGDGHKIPGLYLLGAHDIF